MKPIADHIFHSKTDTELRYIIKDAGEAAIAMRGHDCRAECKYLDQVNDATTVLHYRNRVSSIEIDKITEYGLTQRLSRSIRVF